MYDSDYREVDVTALDTRTAVVEQGADTAGGFDVPTHARRITEIIIQVGPDLTADTLEGFSSAIRLSGSGLQIGEGYFPGPCGAVGGAAATSSGLNFAKGQRYHTNIMVKGGGKINAEAYLHGEDIGAIHVVVQIVYDGPTMGKIVDMDYREVDLTAANTLVVLNNRAGAAEGDFKCAYRKIVEIHFGAGLKPVAGPLRFVPVLHMSGPAFVMAGNYKFAGPSGGTQDDIAISGALVITDLNRFITDIDTKIGENLRASAQMIEDDAGTGYAIVGIGYGA